MILLGLGFVSGDLVAARVIDRWVGSKTGLTGELAEQARHEEIRQQTGADVLIPQQVSD